MDRILLFSLILYASRHGSNRPMFGERLDSDRQELPNDTTLDEISTCQLGIFPSERSHFMYPNDF